MRGLDDAAIRYAGLGWPVFPWGRRAPLTAHGQNDATIDPEVVRAWWSRWPDAVPAVRTGAAVGIVALDVDIGHADGANGFDSLEELGPLPATPTCHTPRGGLHLLFAHPGGEVRTAAIAPGLEVKGERGSIILAPGPGRSWDPHCGLETPLAAMPAWLIPPAPEPAAREPRPTVRLPLSRYGEKALDNAVNRILHAVGGQQRDTLNREVFGIARLVAGGVIPSPLALEALSWAAQQMPSRDSRRPWRPNELQKMVRGAFLVGLAHPRQPGRAV